MRETLRNVLRSGLLRRVLPLILLVSILPLFIFADLSWIGINGIHFAGITLNARQVEEEGAAPNKILSIDVKGVEDLAREGSYEAVTGRSLKGLELRARDLARRIASFLEEREQDLLTLAALPPSADTYIAFWQSKQGTLWRPPENAGEPERLFQTPLYKEIAFIDTSGQEVIRITNGQSMPQAGLRDVSRPENTTYKRETYFAETIDLAPGEVYVQRLLGWYLPRSVAFAGVENPTGQRYQGEMRFCTPVYQNGEELGILVLSLDWTHGIELVEHVVGSDEGYVVQVPAAEGSDPDDPEMAEIYSYLVQDDGWTLAHARHYHIAGLDENGEYVPSISQELWDEQKVSGLIPANADKIGFLGLPHPWPEIARQNRMGVASAAIPDYRSSSGEQKAMAWASVPYYTPPFDTPAGFGWVGISIDAQTFQETPNALAAQIDRFGARLNIRGYAILGLLTVVAVILISYLIYRMISLPVGSMVGIAQRIAHGDLPHIEPPEGKRSDRDELAQLQAALAEMVQQLRLIIARIRGAALHISSAAQEINATLLEQAGAASQSASAVAETTSTMEEMAIIAAEIADRSAVVADEAAETQNDAQTGAQAVADTVAKLDEIRAANESNVEEILSLARKSRRIGEVMELIDNIAARTKLIAFNAALEAAAAGESGQRFSVVAMEVRRLADNVVESTDEIRERIAEIQADTNNLILASEQEAKRIAEGVSRVHEANQTLGEILESSQSTTAAAEQISLSTRQQRTAAEQVVEAARSIQDDSQAVARGSEEATHVIADLVNLAEELRDAVAQFELEEDDGQASLTPNQAQAWLEGDAAPASAATP
ncbi:MAG: methyl-accepting chemotaxis protein [Anaerolineae bacterium]